MRTITSECTSLPANVTVLCHGDSPALVSAVGNADQTTISLVFNDTLDKASAEAVTNYTISGGLSIVSASNNATKVTLTTDGPRTLGSNYMLTVANVRDDSICLNRIYPNPTVITLAQDVRVLSFDAVWKYHNEGQDLGTVWRDPNYNDSAWPQGPGPLGFETTPEIIPLITTWISRTNQVGDPIITDYFRALLNVPFESSGVTFTIRHRVDDGAVFYFNGAEVARFNMPTGVINFATTAPTPPGEGVVRSLTNLTGLAAGPNSFAVEAHQTSLSSTDVLFGAEVIARVPWFLEPQSHLSIVRDADGTVTISWLSQSMVLQESPAVDGPWTNVQGAVSPMRILVPSGNRFYRLRAF